MNNETKNEIEIIPPITVLEVDLLEISELDESSSSNQVNDSTRINSISIPINDSIEHPIVNTIDIITKDNTSTSIPSPPPPSINIETSISTTSPIIVLFVELVITLATIFPLVVGIIYNNIGYILYGSYGISNIPFTVYCLYGLFKLHSKPIYIYYYWKILSIILIVCITIIIGVLAKFDKIPLVHNWWISIIILLGIVFFTIVWNGTCILWIRHVLFDFETKENITLKSEDEENSKIKETSKDENEILKPLSPRSQYTSPEEPLKIAIKKFNKNPESGIQFIEENNVLLNTPYSSIVMFLHSVDELNKFKLGEYLGGNQPINKEMLKNFVNYYNFESKEFDESLRLFLSKFKLPKEAQQIDRVMECFAIKYHNDNPGKFTDSDTPYLLAFSLILLNTDAHNPKIKKKMSKRVFVQNNLNLRKENKHDLTPEYLEKLYDRITSNELKYYTLKPIKTH